MFSIIVPVYKVEEYLDRCVNSILNQTYKNFELILVDDGSPDDCPRLCDEYTKKDFRVKVVHKENGGLSDARNAGLKICTGEHVLFVDSDDYIETCSLEKINENLDEKIDILVLDAVVENGKCDLEHNPDLIGKVLTGKDYLKKALSKVKMPMAVWLNVYRKEFLTQNDLTFRKGLLHEDELFSPYAFLKADKVKYAPIKYYHYVLRESSITTTSDLRKNAEHLYSTCCELNDLYNTISDRKLRNLLKDSLVMKYLNIYQVGNLIKYGKKYVHKKFVFKNAKLIKTRLKAFLFILSPALYYRVNKTVKGLKK